MIPSLRILARPHLLTLLGGKPMFEHGNLIAPRVGDAERGGLTVKPVGANRVACRSDAVELAPGEHFDRAWLVGGRLLLEKLDLGGAGGLGAHFGDRLIEAWPFGHGGSGGGRRGLRAIAQTFFAGGIGRLEAAIGAVEIIELRVRRKRQQGDDRRERGAAAAHARHHSSTSAIVRSACGVLTLALAACSADGSSFDLHRASLAGLPKPGILFDAPPPDVVVRRGGPSGELLAGPTVPALPDDAVDTSIGSGLRNWLTPLERRQLAEASQRAVLGITGTPVAWAAADPAGTETAKGLALPVDDAQRSVRGRVCRDLWQSVDKAGETHQQQVTLCRRDYGNGLSLWALGDANQWP
jgi:surface antigen